MTVVHRWLAEPLPRIVAQALQRLAAAPGVPRDVELGELSDAGLQKRVARDVRIEFGTLGRGNHFLEVQADDEGQLWLMVHSGSRALGPAVRDHHLAAGEAVGKGLLALDPEGAGRRYLADHHCAIAFAQQNRRAIAEAAARALHDALAADVVWDTWFDVVHNFVRREEHDGVWLWVHRKGASSARADEAGVIPGSMGSWSFHVAGRGCAASLCSSSHGAGRRLARGDAMRTISRRDLERDLAAVFFERQLASRLLDEAPTAYKDISAVMRAQRDLVRIVRRLRPVLAYKGA